MEVNVDAREVRQWGRAMAGAPAVFQREMVRTTNGLLLEGVGIAQENAPVEDGLLRAAIRVVDAATVRGAGVSGSYGPRGVIYARIQELGGTIVAKAAEWLHFKTRDGNWVKVKSVTITGKHYLQNSKNALRPRLKPAFSIAVSRALDSVRGR